VVGVCTSGSPAHGRQEHRPRLRALALATIGTELVVDCRGRKADAVVVKTPFYKRPAR
jgi:aminomethyltransferase